MFTVLLSELNSDELQRLIGFYKRFETSISKLLKEATLRT